MAYKEIKDVEADDPMELVAVVLPADAESAREMAYAFAEEFARMGYHAGQIETLFRTPFYAGAHHAFVALGEAEIQLIVGECVAAWGGSTVTVQDVQTVQSVQDDLNDLNHWNDSNLRREESDDG